MRRATDSLSKILRELTRKYGFHRRANISISMPDDTIFFHTFDSDSDDSQKDFKAHLKHSFPIRSNDLVGQIISSDKIAGNNSFVLATATSSELIRERLKTLSQAGIHPKLIDTDFFAALSVAAVNCPEIQTGKLIVAYCDISFLTFAVIHNNELLVIRKFPLNFEPNSDSVSVQQKLADLILYEINITWQKIFGQNPDSDTKLFLLPGPGIPETFEKIILKDIGLDTVIVDPSAKVKSSPKFKNAANMSLAQGLAIRGLASKDTRGVNFLDSLNTNIIKTFNFRKELIICGLLLAAVVCTFLFGLFIRLSHLEAEYTQINSSMKTIFQKALPEESRIVNPLAQLEHQLATMQKECSLFGLTSRAAPSPLEILYAVTTKTPPEMDIRINDVLITAESVRLTGNAKSFESLYKWQQQLQNIPNFVSVDIQNDIEKHSENKLVRFTILVSLETMEKQ
jgi:Tfp pilus assembly PilM family ATPase